MKEFKKENHHTWFKWNIKNWIRTIEPIAQTIAIISQSFYQNERTHSHIPHLHPHICNYINYWKWFVYKRKLIIIFWPMMVIVVAIFLHLCIHFNLIHSFFSILSMIFFWYETFKHRRLCQLELAIVLYYMLLNHHQAIVWANKWRFCSKLYFFHSHQSISNVFSIYGCYSFTFIHLYLNSTPPQLW